MKDLPMPGPMQEVTRSFAAMGVNAADAAPRIRAFGEACDQAWRQLGLGKFSLRTIRRKRKQLLEIRTFTLK